MTSTVAYGFGYRDGDLRLQSLSGVGEGSVDESTSENSFYCGVLWLLLACSPLVFGNWLHLGFESGMIIWAGIVYGPVGIVGGFLLLKQYEARRSARERQEESTDRAKSLMMLMLRDDHVVVIYASAPTTRDGIEAIDIQNEGVPVLR
jgi:hypothetical protein